MPSQTNQFSRDPIRFIDKFIGKNELGKPFILADHQREILRLAFQFDANGKMLTTRSSIAA
jgi:hypothetical protein